MNKKSIKILLTIFTVVVVLISVSSIVYAYGPGDFKSIEEMPSESILLGEKILGIIQAVGNFVALGALLVIGIKYVTGSVEEKASYKRTMIPYIVAAVLVFSSVNIAQIVYKVSNSVKVSPGTTGYLMRQGEYIIECKTCGTVMSYEERENNNNKCTGCGLILVNE